MPTKLTMADISQWIDNDEGLYDWFNSWRREQYPRSRRTRRIFITEHREELTACIRRVLDGDRPAHYLKYGS